MHPAQPGDADNNPGCGCDPAGSQPETADTAERRGCLEVGVAVFALIVALLGGSAVIGIYVEVWTENTSVGSAVLTCASTTWFALHAARIAVAVGLDGFERLQGWLWSATYCVLFLSAPLALLLYGVDLWWTGHAPDRAGGIAASLITGFLIGVAVGAAITKHRSKDATGRV
jgi:hypothetical protein